MLELIGDRSWLDVLRMVLDVGIVGYVVYRIMMYVQGTRAVYLVRGIVLLFVVWLVSSVLGLVTIKFILSQVLLYGILGLMIIFQPELRSMLETLGSRNWLGKATTVNSSEKVLDDLVESMVYMSKRRIGALIVLERGDSLMEFAKTGIAINADVSKELVMNIFTPNVPLHDGALIMSGDKILAGSCYLPLTERSDISKELGTRHRAGIGLGEVCDGVVLIVSEETGAMSIVEGSNLYRGLEEDEVRDHLNRLMLGVSDSQAN